MKKSIKRLPKCTQEELTVLLDLYTVFTTDYYSIFYR